MPITTQNIRQFGQDGEKVLSYISLRRAFLAVGGIQLCMAFMFMISGGILGFGYAGFLTASTLGIIGLVGLSFGFLSKPIDAPYILARRIKRIKVFTASYIFLLALLLVIALLTLAWEFWDVVQFNSERERNPAAADIRDQFSVAFEIVMSFTVLLLAAVPMAAFGLNLRDVSTKIDYGRDGP